MKIRALEGEEKIKSMAMTTYAFARSPSDYEKRFNERKEFRKEDLVLAISEDGEIESTATFIPMTQNIRGKIVKMCRVAGVATYPEKRRKGHVKKLMAEGFKKMREQGQVVSTLYPFRESFYERMGYSTFPQMKYATVDPAHIRRAIRVQPLGEVRRFNVSDELDTYKAFVTQYLHSCHSAVRFSDLRMDEIQKDPKWLAIAYDEDGTIIGIMTYTISGFEGEMKIRHFYYLNSQAKYLLLEWMGRHTDQVKKVTLPLNSHEFVATWLTDVKAKLRSWDWVPSPMGRVVDVIGLEGIEVGEGEISLQIEDNYCAWNNRIFTFKSVEGKLRIEEGGNQNAKVSMSGFSSLIYGTASPEDFLYLGYGDLRGNISKIQKLFPRMTCYLNESF